jgi:hypothetical protein
LQPHKADFVLSALLAYAAIILRFVGAIHWGRSLHEPHMVGSNLLQIISIIPALMIWAVLIVPHQIGLMLLILGFVLIYLFDQLQYERTVLNAENSPSPFNGCYLHTVSQFAIGAEVLIPA